MSAPVGSPHAARTSPHRDDVSETSLNSQTSKDQIMASDTAQQDSAQGSREQHVRSRTIPAPVSAVFALLTDPTRHRETEPGDWVRSARDAEPITEVGQVFGMDMYADGAGGDYVMHSRVIAFEPERTVAWMPGQYDDSGTWGAGRWTWRYDLEPTADNHCRVTLTYDWSDVPHDLRKQFGGFPPFGAEFLDESLAALEAAVTR